MIEQERKRRRGETASDETTGKGVKARQHSERGFRGIGKPGRRAVEKESANKRAVERDSAEGPQEREEIDLRARRRGTAAERRLEM